MAIAKTIDFKGIVVNDAYIRVTNPTISEDKSTITADLSFYAYKGAPEFDKSRFTCAYDLEGYNPIKQGYDYIKTLEQYSGAVDC